MKEIIPQIKRLGKAASSKVLFAAALLEKGDAEQAIAECRVALELNPRLAQAHLLLGTIYKELGRFDEAEKVLKAAVELDPYNALRLLSELYLDDDRLEEALEARLAAIEREADNAGDFVRLGEIYHELGSHEKSAQALRHALRLDPQAGVVHHKLALALLAMGRDEEAMAELGEALRLNPGFALSHILLGDLYAARREYEAAVAQYREALQHNPKMADVYFKLSELHFAIGEYQFAVLGYRMALFLRPKYPEAHHRLGNIYHHYGQYDLALRQYHAALALHPGYARALADAGDAHLMLEEHRQATESYRAALALEHRNCERADALAAEGKLLEAVSHYRQELALSPEAIAPETVAGKLPFPAGPGEAEKRKEPRFLLKMPVDVRKGPREYIQATVVNVSSKGMLLETAHDLVPGSELEILTTIEHDRQKISLRGKVARNIETEGQEAKRFGISLVDDHGEWEDIMKP